MKTITTPKIVKFGVRGWWNFQSVPGFSYREFSLPDSITYGDNHDNWRDKLRNHENCTTYLEGYNRLVESRDGLCIETNPNSGNSYTREGFLYSLFVEPTLLSLSSNGFTSAENQAKAFFLNKLVKAQTKFSGSVAAGELGETLRAIRNPAKTLRNSLKNYLRSLKKKKRKYDGDSLQKVAADTYLEYVFGWRPLISDINDAVGALGTVLKGQPITARGLYEEVDIDRKTFDPTSFGRLHYTRTTTQQWEVIFRGYFEPEVDNRSFSQAGIFGFKPEEFIPTAWELLPWSFLWDYFLNIGDILQGWSYGRSGLKWSSRTKRVVHRIKDTDGVIRTLPNAYNIFVSGTPHSYVVEATRIRRETYTGDFIPTLEFQVPGMATQWINMAALLASHDKLLPFSKKS